jgi:hypothetical protein
MRRVSKREVVVYFDGNKEYWALVKALLPNDCIVLIYVNDEGHSCESPVVSFINNYSTCDYWRFPDIELRLS